MNASKNCKLFGIFLFLFLGSCGYRVSEGTSFRNLSFSVPYVTGDKEGWFTQELLYALSSSGMCRYSPSRGEVKLCVSITSMTKEQIGYRHEQHNDGTSKKNIIATEERERVEAVASLVSKDSGDVLWGPFKFSEFIDYDYINQDSRTDLTFVTSLGKKEKVLSFSLGQLGAKEDAQDEALLPIYRLLAKKIVDAILNE